MSEIPLTVSEKAGMLTQSAYPEPMLAKLSAVMDTAKTLHFTGWTTWEAWVQFHIQSKGQVW